MASVIDESGLNEINDPSNCMTLCLNCQRLKTMLEGDHLTPRGHGGARPGAGAPRGEWVPNEELLKLMK